MALKGTLEVGVLAQDRGWGDRQGFVERDFGAGEAIVASDELVAEEDESGGIAGVLVEPQRGVRMEWWKRG